MSTNLEHLEEMQALDDIEADVETNTTHLTDIKGPGFGVDASLAHLASEISHANHIFPEDTDETVTLTSGGGAHTFGAWAEVVDNNAVALSSLFAAAEGHIPKVFLEELNGAAGVIYLLEFAYGAAKTIIKTLRFVSPGAAVKNVPWAGDHGVGLDIPVGETVYYRMKDSTGGKTSVVHFSYFTYA